jgi:hypothetical protein
MALPTPRTWVVGETVTAALMNAEVRDAFTTRTVRWVYQAADRTVNNSTTYVNSDISFTPDTDATYWYSLYISYSADGNADFKWAWSAPQATFGSFTQSRHTDATGSFNSGAEVIFRRPSNSTDRLAGGATGTDPLGSFYSAYDSGTFTTTSTSGTVTMQFAQYTAAAVDTILRGGSTHTQMVYQRIA